MATNPYISTLYIRNRYYEYATDWEAVTVKTVYADGKPSFNELSDTAPKSFELVYQFDKRQPDEAANLAVFDAHFDSVRYSRPFSFLTKAGVTLDNVYYKEYTAEHEGHKSWAQTRRIVLIKYDFGSSSTVTPPPVGVTAPSVPLGLAVASTTSSTITLTWSASAAGTNPVSGYKLLRSGVEFNVGNVLTYQFTSLSASTAYTFQVLAYDAAGYASAYSVTVTGTTAAAPANTTPDAPTAPVTDDTNDTYSWTNSPGLNAVTDYELTTNGGTSYSAVTAKPQPVGNYAFAVGQVGVRVKSAAGRNVSATVYNTLAFTLAGNANVMTWNNGDPITYGGAAITHG